MILLQILVWLLFIKVEIAHSISTTTNNNNNHGKHSHQRRKRASARSDAQRFVVRHRPVPSTSLVDFSSLTPIHSCAYWKPRNFQPFPRSVLSDHRQCPMVMAKLQGLAPDLTRNQMKPPIPFHSRIELVYPPNLFLRHHDHRAQQEEEEDQQHHYFPVIWDIFIKHDTLVVLLSRYLEIYSNGTYTAPNFLRMSMKWSWESNSNVTTLGDYAKSNDLPDLSSPCFRHSIGTNFTCFHGVSSFQQRQKGYGHFATVSTDSLVACMVPIQSMPIESKTTKALSHSCSAKHQKLKNREPYKLTVDYLGIRKTFHLTPIDQDPSTPSYSHHASHAKNKSFIFVSSMVGEKPRISATEITTWLEFHQRLGVNHFYLYYMYPLSQLSVEHVKTLNAYVEKTNVSLSIVQWHKLYWPLPSIFKRQPRGCGHLAILQSTLYRQKECFTYCSSPLEFRTKVMLEIDVDDFVVPHKPYCDRVIREGNTSVSQNDDACFMTLPDLLQSIKPWVNASALEFQNSYFYLLTNDTFKQGEHLFKNQENNSVKEWISFANQHILSNNFSFLDLQQSVIIRENDLKKFSFRPKLLYDVNEVLFVGPHRIYATRNPFGEVIQAGFYLHFLQPSIGRGLEMINQPIKTTLFDLTNGYLGRR